MGDECPQCGAGYIDPGESCQRRFSMLLALDHSRQEPWGSRHGSAFAAYTLQHPDGIHRNALGRCWVLLYRIWISGDDPVFVARTLRQIEDGVTPPWTVPPPPADASIPRRYRVNISDLGAFDAANYPERLKAWCEATLEALGQPVP